MHINSEHPISLKNSIDHSQVLRVKRTCSTIEKFKIYCSETKKKLLRKDKNLTLKINALQQSKNWTEMKR